MQALCLDQPVLQVPLDRLDHRAIKVSKEKLDQPDRLVTLDLPVQMGGQLIQALQDRLVRKVLDQLEKLDQLAPQAQ